MDKSIDQLITDTKNFLSLKRFDEAIWIFNNIIKINPKLY